MRLLLSLILLSLAFYAGAGGAEAPTPVKPPVVDAAAEYALGIKWAEGTGVPKDSVKAIRHFRKAAELGDARAQDRLGTIFANGEGVPKDFIEGLAWYNLAAADGTKAYVDHRNSLEHQIGIEATLLAQRRSKQLLEVIGKIQPTAVPPSPETAGQIAPVGKPKEVTRMSYKEYLAKHPAPDAAKNAVTKPAGVQPNGERTLPPQNLNSVGIFGRDARWSEQGDYLNEMLQIIQTQWARVVAATKVQPPHGSHVVITFKLNAKGGTEIGKIEDSGAGQPGVSSCQSAITDLQPYRKWTDQMIAALGDEQSLTLIFYYR